MISSTFLKKSC